ncbi:hypothetical protein A3F37_02545 [Candidatus Saccharibacteria bacterium RIFCSPHIGHO2_12_FULL_41_12]|nr:MAG: hypothetical protein A3F37_02545 [Candidatus Saccharibacteria bacterium RIFCSPHIGHO2_12_FULL_41_12]
MFSFFASEGPHIAIAPEKLFNIGGVTITNSMIYGWIVCTLIIVALIYGVKKITVNGSHGPAQILDFGVEFIHSTTANSLGTQERARKYTPYFATIFFFVLINNWMGLLPFVGKSFTYDGTALLRPFTADFNGTLSMALVAIILVQVFAIKESGSQQHLRHYFAGSLFNPLTYLIGLMEVFQEFTRLFSLALRLFLNVVIGEILIAIFAYLGGALGFLTAVPFTLMEVFIGLLQAYIFVILTVSYLSVALSHSHDSDEVSA